MAEGLETQLPGIWQLLPSRQALGLCLHHEVIGTPHTAGQVTAKGNFDASQPPRSRMINIDARNIKGPRSAKSSTSGCIP